MRFWAVVLCCLFSLVGVLASVDSIVTQSIFEEMLPYRNDARCPANGFYTYAAFIAAARSYPAFGTTGDLQTQKREIAAFFGQTSQETTGGWATAEGGPFAWGYCFKEESPPSAYCVPSVEWPCVAGQNYSGRGPIQLSYNYNYGPAGNSAEINLNLLANPNIVKDDPTISFKTALWFWMTPQPPKPSCHDVMTGNWTPSAADTAAGRLPGYGVCTNIINGGIECGQGWGNAQMKNRIGFYTRHGLILNLSSYGDNLDCANQRPFGSGVGHAPF